jgi:hypothetical protein
VSGSMASVAVIVAPIGLTTIYVDYSSIAVTYQGAASVCPRLGGLKIYVNQTCRYHLCKLLIIRWCRV